MNISRRRVLQGLGGLACGLPTLESFSPRRAKAAPGSATFAIFLRQANGVARAADNGPIGPEDEKFWPRDYGALTPESMSGRAVDELLEVRDRLLVIGNVNGNRTFEYGGGHDRGALQCLTATARDNVGAGEGESKAGGESLDNRIGRELNDGGRDSLFLYSGRDGWLGGPCISQRGPSTPRSAIRDPMQAYGTMMGMAGAQIDELLVKRRQSVNDLLRSEFQTVLSNTRLSTTDKRRLELHRESIRELELTLACNFEADTLATLEGLSPGYDSDDGNLVLAAARAHLHVAALAVGCGFTRSVALQIGSGNDGSTRYEDPATGQLMANYHFISHRENDHGGAPNATAIAGADVLHHQVDRHFGKTFRHLIDLLAASLTPTGNLLDDGVAVWLNDNSSGPPHGSDGIPWILAGSAGGYFKQGQYVKLAGDSQTHNHNQVLNTIGAAVGVKNANSEPLDDFGAATNAKGQSSELLA